MAITLAEAETQLAEALAALSKARTAAAYSVADRSSTRQDLQALQSDVRLWERKCKELSNAAAGVTNPGFYVPRWT